MLRTLVFGYDELLLESIDFLTAAKAEIPAIVFPSTRQDVRADKIRSVVRENGYLILDQPPRRSIGAFAETLNAMDPDLILVWSYPMILPIEVIQIPRLGCVNIHFGVLPQYRGVNGVRWALMNGEDTTGVTLHFMDEGIDSGDIIAKVTFPISDEDNILSLMQKSIFTGRLLLEQTWPSIASGKVESVRQDNSKAGYYSSTMEMPVSIDWSRTNVEIHNLIRASTAPYSGAYTHSGGRKFRVIRSFIQDSFANAKPGTIEKLDSAGIHVATGSGQIILVDVQVEGHETISSRSDANAGLRVGDSFEG